MATFQVHEDIENIGSKIHTKKLCHGDEKKIIKKTFGDSNVSVQPLSKNVLKEQNKTKIPIKKYLNKENEHSKKSNVSLKNVEKDKKESTNVEINNALMENSFFKIDCKENVEDEKQTAVKAQKEYCPYSILHEQYGEEIYKYLRHLEEHGPRVKPNYMLKQIELNWGSRAILIDWLVSISDEYDLSHETLHISVNYVDRFLSTISVVRNKFQLVGAAAMRLASKMEEYQPLDTSEWSYLTGETFTPKQILKMEHIILKVLGFNLKSPTICDFIQHLSSEYKMDDETIHFALYISELILLEGEDYLSYFPSKLAAACIALARYNLSKPNPWPSKLKKASGYSLKELSPVVQRQHKTLEESPLKDQKAIATKYTSSRYNKVALLKPRALSLEYLEKCSTEEP